MPKAGVFLGIETSADVTGLALVRHDACLATAAEASQARHNEVILGLLDRLFERAGLPTGSLSGIAVSLGPGMFTSLRVGLSVAKGLALGLDLPLKGISTADALVMATRPLLTPEQQGLPVLPLLDARKNEVLYSRYDGEQRVDGFQLLSPDRLPGLVAGPVVICGSGGTRYRSALAAGFEARARFLDITSPPPETIAFLGRAALIAGQADDPTALVPTYLRPTDAEVKHRTIAAATQ
jgi:tRNA threonylcarbamoyladenosine biosynthesis protein TsaB